MRVGRRSFLGGSAIVTLGTGCLKHAPPPPPPAPPKSSGSARDDVLAQALEAAKKAGATYADARIVRRRTENIWTREDHIAGVGSGETYGIGIRVIADGAWGFASSALVTRPAVEEAARRAVAIAKASRATLKHPVTLAPAPVAKGVWRTPMEVDPFQVPLADKAQWLLALWPLVKDVPFVKFASAGIQCIGEHKVFASSEGTLVEQEITRVSPSLSVTAVDAGQFESRAAEVPPMQAGWEYVTMCSIPKTARSLAEDAGKKLKAASVTPGKKDLILAPSNLWLTIHESVGHPTELDRMLGLEANLAGTSFATVDKLGKLKYAADIVTLYADKLVPGGLATCQWDDDGVATQRWDLVKDGLFVGVQTTRDQASWIGEKESRGSSYAQDHSSVAFQRMPNVSLAPSSKDTSLDDIIAATEDGVLISGNGSWSIDHQRYNFQFSGQTFHEIKKGKIVRPLRDVAYQSNSVEFWNSCDMLGGEKTWELHGALHDGKGEPMQSNAVSHGCPPARFKKVDILNVNARARVGGK
ncbi:MAG: TldD/PmbA family protein [Labilithrix sp.]|nr:TldD/PmbA family protein [Labilithrix sp.]MCW5817224.1 TldD/PmbA family protein [Labilithrix sp.]